MKVAPDAAAAAAATAAGAGAPESDGVASVRASSSPQLSPLTPDRCQSFLFSGLRTPVAVPPPVAARDGWLTPSQLYNSLNASQPHDGRFLLLVDTRHADDYGACRVAGAVPSSRLPSLAVGRFTLVVVYDHKGLSLELRQSPLSGAVALLRARRAAPFVLSGGFDSFHAVHPYLCTPPLSEGSPAAADQYPSLILDASDGCGLLYLGEAASERVVEDLRLTHVVNAGGDPRTCTAGLASLHLPLPDDADLLAACSAVTRFLHAALPGGAVLVHCERGVSGSAALVIGFLMASRHWTLRDAVDFVRDRRPVVQPSGGFVRQLARFEVILYGRRYTDRRLLYS